MTNVEKLKKIGHLGELRVWLGAEKKTDTLVDETINDMTHEELISEWCQMKFGDSGYWHVLKNFYNSLENMK